MPMLNKQDICASFQDIELCALLKSKDLCPIMLQKMLEKLYIQCIVNRVNKASLIEEAKVHRIKNYTRISKEAYTFSCGIMKNMSIHRTLKE